MKKQIPWLVLLMASGLLINLSCRKDIRDSVPQKNEETIAVTGENSLMRENKRKITVSTVQQLYLAVNDVQNEGTQIILEPATYTLTAFPGDINGGRLLLQRDMELLGKPGQPDSVVIDASMLPPSSFPAAPNRSGAISIGKGSNSIEWMTIKGNTSTANAFAAIDTDRDTGPASVVLSHLIVKNSLTGISIRNRQAIHEDRVLEAYLFDNEITDNQFMGGQGIAIQNSAGATSAIIHATLKNNYSHNNKVGLRTWNQHTSSGQIFVTSTNDRFEENGIGIILNGGRDDNGPATISMADNNFLSFDAQGTEIRNNTGTLPPDNPPTGGIYVAGGHTSLVANRTSNNNLEMSLRGCTISGNQGHGDINAFGARSLSPDIAGTNNKVNIYLYGFIRNAFVLQDDSAPDEAALTNRVFVHRF